MNGEVGSTMTCIETPTLELSLARSPGLDNGFREALYPKALSILRREVPDLNLYRLIAIYTRSLLVDIIYPKIKPQPPISLEISLKHTPLCAIS